jgi:hypothetical protein
MACPNYRINPNYTPGSNYPQYEYTDIASTAQFDPYAASHPQPKPSQQSFAPTVTPYHHNHDTNQVAGPPAGPQHHFIADLPPELKSDVSSTTASPPTNQQQQRQEEEEPRVHPAVARPTEKSRMTRLSPNKSVRYEKLSFHKSVLYEKLNNNPRHAADSIPKSTSWSCISYYYHSPHFFRRHSSPQERNETTTTRQNGLEWGWWCLGRYFARYFGFGSRGYRLGSLLGSTHWLLYRQ